MKILCLGRHGNNRASTLAWLLKTKKHDAIAVGMRCMGRDTRKMMLDWADLIILLHEKCGAGVSKEYWKKLKIWLVDITYSMKYDIDLTELFESYIERDNL